MCFEGGSGRSPRARRGGGRKPREGCRRQEEDITRGCRRKFKDDIAFPRAWVAAFRRACASCRVGLLSLVTAFLSESGLASNIEARVERDAGRTKRVACERGREKKGSHYNRSDTKRRWLAHWGRSYRKEMRCQDVGLFGPFRSVAFPPNTGVVVQAWAKCAGGEGYDRGHPQWWAWGGVSCSVVFYAGCCCLGCRSPTFPAGPQ